MEFTGLNRRDVIVGTTAVGASAVAGFSSTATAATPSSPVLAIGSRGAAVTALQNHLNTLGYWCGAADGGYSAQTAQAVMALQKVAGIGRDGVAGSATQRALASGFRPGSRRGGNRLEVDKSRQVVLVVRDGAVKFIFNTSTGSGQYFTYYGQTIKAVTPSGEFTVNRHGTDGWDMGPLGGLWRPYYFNGGIAFHGALEIPGYPASHGCCRLSIAAQDFLITSGLLAIGESVSVY